VENSGNLQLRGLTYRGQTWDNPNCNSYLQLFRPVEPGVRDRELPARWLSALPDDAKGVPARKGTAANRNQEFWTSRVDDIRFLEVPNRPSQPL